MLGSGRDDDVQDWSHDDVTICKDFADDDDAADDDADTIWCLKCKPKQCFPAVRF